MSPSRRRQAVLMLVDRLGVSERRACLIAGQHRSTQRREPCVAPDDAALRGRLREISAKRPRWVDVAVPVMTMNSPMNPLVPGRPTLASVATTKRAAYTGIGLASPPKSSMWRVCRRS